MFEVKAEADNSKIRIFFLQADQRLLRRVLVAESGPGKLGLGSQVFTKPG
ncbi:MAG: hypothetical protein NZ935_06500 [Planctomycetes bacterium]|nr:hypothetical protein [Planctomycetota bacterium]